VWKHRVHAADAVDELRDAEVDDQARERKRIPPFEAVLSPHQLEHRVGGERRSLVEVLVEPEGQPRGW
jgi:hypothetical protein